MATEAFSVRTDAEKVQQLDRLAKQMDRSRNYIVNQAIDVKEGIRAADHGKFASDAQMEQIFDKYNKG